LSSLQSVGRMRPLTPRVLAVARCRAGRNSTIRRVGSVMWPKPRFKSGLSLCVPRGGESRREFARERGRRARDRLMRRCGRHRPGNRKSTQSHCKLHPWRRKLPMRNREPVHYRPLQSSVVGRLPCTYNSVEFLPSTPRNGGLGIHCQQGGRGNFRAAGGNLGRVRTNCAAVRK
jgi:hypothetical protein